MNGVSRPFPVRSRATLDLLNRGNELSSDDPVAPNVSIQQATN
jgi:hypothetical protein